MKIFFQLLAYSYRYKYRFWTGILLAFLTAVLNGITLSAMIPLFDSLDPAQDKAFKLKFTLPESTILVKEQILGKESLDGLERIKKVIIDLKVYLNEKTKDLDSKEVVWAVSIFIIPIYILKLLTYLGSVACIATAGYMAVRDLRQELFDKTQKLPLTFFYKEKTGLIMSRIINDAEIIAAVISSNLRDAIVNFFYVFTNLLILVYLNLELLISAIVVVPIVILPVTLFTRKISRSTEKYQERLGELNAHLEQTISGIRVIRGFNSHKLEESKFEEINQKVYRRTFKGQFYLQIAPNLVELSSSLVVLAFFAMGAKLIFSGRFTQGEFMAFLLTLLFLLRPLTQLSQMVGKISVAISAGKRVFEILQLPLDTETELGNSYVEKVQDSIQFQNISFIYPGTTTEVLKSINLDVKVGESYAFVGQSGSGKSTLMDLLPRFFDPVDGKILLDGRDIREIKLSDLRKKIGIVTQDIFLFSGTIHDNIAYGKQGATRKDVIRAARLAHAHDFIKSMEKGYDTILGVRGLNLSGGQRQRLVIARALLRDPEILILDEATSALDVESERMVNDAIDRLLRNRTTFVIAHRLSTIRRIKNIVVMEEGEIKEIGDHESLLSQNGIYRKLHDNQFQGAEIIT